MQARSRLLHAWTQQVVTLLVGIRVTQARTLAAFSLGLIWAGCATLPRIARTVPGPARGESVERRLRRYLANSRVDPRQVWAPVVRGLAPRVAGPGQEVTLVFDPTPHRGHATVLMLSVVVHKRALPVSWRVVPQQEDWPEKLGPLFRAMAAEVNAALPAGATATLLADRGLVGPTLVDGCRAAGWHLVLRLKASPKDAAMIRLPGEAEVRLTTFVARRVARPGHRWSGPAAILKGEGWRQGFVTIYWGRGAAEPWVLFSDRAGGYARVREYRRRGQVEAAYQDGKGRGFRLGQSRVSLLTRDLDRLDRLLLAVALATWWLHGLGGRVVRAGLRSRYDRADRRDRSLVQLGRDHLLALLDEGSGRARSALTPFRLGATGLVYRWSA
jgi:hypothetical protein